MCYRWFTFFCVFFMLRRPPSSKRMNPLFPYTTLFRSPRTILKKVLGLYADKCWKPIIAPEVEFYLVSQNTDPDFPLTPPTGQSGRSESASQPYGLEALNEYEDIIDHIYDDCELMGLDIDTIIHEKI